ncbi:MAG: CPBP family intramembrane metalloprotease [Candidatus Micrarchaeota archaeon]|nr:CPBP family intramembrane metalloprotease [Candidatus Micrarchaeota archaeon]
MRVHGVREVREPATAGQAEEVGVCLARRGTKPRARSRAAGSGRYPLKYLVYAITLLLIAFEVWAAATGYSNFANTQIALELIFFFVVLSYLMLKGHRLGEAIDSLGLGRRSIRARYIATGVFIFFILFVVELAISAFSTITNIPLPSNVEPILAQMPLYFLVLSFTLVPLCEETLFRGFLVPRAGILVSAIIFTALHFSYGSISEAVAAFVFALLAGYYFRRTGSLYTTMTAHALVNLLTVILIFS